jgi:hypothetical protein
MREENNIDNWIARQERLMAKANLVAAQFPDAYRETLPDKKTWVWMATSVGARATDVIACSSKDGTVFLCPYIKIVRGDTVARVFCAKPTMFYPHAFAVLDGLRAQYPDAHAALLRVAAEYK